MSKYQELNIVKVCICYCLTFSFPTSLSAWCTLIMFILNFYSIEHRMQKRQNHMFVDDLAPRWEREMILLCFMYFLRPKMWFSSCYCLAEVHIPHGANTLPFFSHGDDLLILINSRSQVWQRIIQTTALISGCAYLT